MTGLVVDESEYNAENRELVSELCFKKHTEQQFINNGRQKAKFIVSEYIYLVRT